MALHMRVRLESPLLRRFKERFPEHVLSAMIISSSLDVDIAHFHHAHDAVFMFGPHTTPLGGRPHIQLNPLELNDWTPMEWNSRNAFSIAWAAFYTLAWRDADFVDVMSLSAQA